MSEGRRLNKEHSLSTNNVRNAIIVAASAGAGAGVVPPINLHEVRKKDQINLKEKDQKTIKKIRSASLNRQHQPTSSIPLIPPRTDKGHLKGACACAVVRVRSCVCRVVLCRVR